MAATYPYSDLVPYCDLYLTTYLKETCREPGPHSHHHQLPTWMSRIAKELQTTEGIAHKPRADVVETPSNFTIDVELPGLERKADLTLKWLSTRTILIACTIPPTVAGGHAAQVANAAKSASAASKPADVSNGTAASVKPVVPEHKTPQHRSISERTTGEMSRAFDFPVDVDRAQTKGRLSGGLLTLVVPKAKHEAALESALDVEFEGELAPWFTG